MNADVLEGALARDVQQLELSIGGMTCAACAARIERKLNKIEGVTATVNFAAEKAEVSFSVESSPQDLVKVVEDAGYTATLPSAVRPSQDEEFPRERTPTTNRPTTPASGWSTGRGTTRRPA